MSEYIPEFAQKTNEQKTELITLLCETSVWSLKLTEKDVKLVIHGDKSCIAESETPSRLLVNLLEKE